MYTILPAWSKGYMSRLMTKPTKMACAPSEDSDQSGHPPSLIRVFAVRKKETWVLSYPLSAQWRLIGLGGCPGWFESSMGAQSLCWLCHETAHMWVSHGRLSQRKIFKWIHVMSHKHPLSRYCLWGMEYKCVLSPCFRREMGKTTFCQVPLLSVIFTTSKTLLITGDVIVCSGLITFPAGAFSRRWSIVYDCGNFRTSS